MNRRTFLQSCVSPAAVAPAVRFGVAQKERAHEHTGAPIIHVRLPERVRIVQ